MYRLIVTLSDDGRPLQWSSEKWDDRLGKLWTHVHQSADLSDATIEQTFAAARAYQPEIQLTFLSAVEPELTQDTF